MYSPKIDEKHIPVLYQLGKQVKKPMTHLVNEALVEYLAKSDSLIGKLVEIESVGRDENYQYAKF